MAFWCSRTLKERIVDERLIEPFSPDHIKHGAYELGVGPEALVTSSRSNDTKLAPTESIIIPPGQLAILVTQEVVGVPDDSIAFISIRAGIKFRGLVNVSGFHVDPGYRQRLRFAVYNAGSQPIILDQNERVFMIWYSEFDDVVDDPYKNPPEHAESDTEKPKPERLINSDLKMKLQGEVASPAELKRRIDELKVVYDQKILALEKEQFIIRALCLGLILAIVGVVIKWVLDTKKESTPPTGWPTSTVAPRDPVKPALKGNAPQAILRPSAKAEVKPDGSPPANPIHPPTGNPLPAVGPPTQRTPPQP